MAPYKITQAEADAIRFVARKSSGVYNIKLSVGIRVCFSQALENVNSLLLPQNDDLSDHMEWGRFRRGFDLTADGRGHVDIYVYSLGDDAELKTNVQAIFAGGRLVRVDGTDQRTSGAVFGMWSL